MLILFNVAYGKAGGGLRAVAEAYEAYLPAADCTVLGFRVSGDPASTADAITHLKSSGHFDLRAMWSARRLIVRHRPDGVICHCSRSLAIFGPAARRFRIPTIGITHSIKLKRFLGADYMIALSPAMRAELLGLNYPESRILMQPNFVAQPKRISERKNLHGARSRPIRLGFLSRLERRKGAHIAIEAVQELARKGIPARLTIAGVGDERESLSTLSKELGVAADIDFVGWCADLDAFFASVDALIVASDYETFGLTIIEAFARNTPVITCRFRGFPEDYFIPNRNCFVTSARTGESFAETVQWCLDHPDQVAQVTAQAHKDFLAEFEAHSAAIRLRDRLTKICAETPPL